MQSDDVYFHCSQASNEFEFVSTSLSIYTYAELITLRHVAYHVTSSSFPYLKYELAGSTFSFADTDVDR